MSELIIAADAPSAAGPYSPGLVLGDWIFLSGQGGFDPDTGELVSDTVADQTRQAFRNVEVLLRAAGASLDDVVSCLVHLHDLAQFDEFNASYEQQFPSQRQARGIALPVVGVLLAASAAAGLLAVTVAGVDGRLPPESLYGAAKIWGGRRSPGRSIVQDGWVASESVTGREVGRQGW